MAIYRFFEMTAVGHLGVAVNVWDHRHRIPGDVCRCTNFGWNRRSRRSL